MNAYTTKALGRIAILLVGTGPHAWADLVRQVFERDQVCQSCGVKLVWKQNYECCHIVDRASGGSDELENLVAKCYLCSKEKVYAN